MAGVIGVVGGGAWGTALAVTARRAGADVTLWSRNPAVIADVNNHHENRGYLPGIALDPRIRATADPASLAAADAVLLVVPAQHVRAMAAQLAPWLRPGLPVILAAKGVEIGTGALMGEVLTATLPGQPWAVLSGPTFAAEVARGLPTAVTLAAADADLGRDLVRLLGTPNFRPYLSDDRIGAEIGGAVKNVLAIACGIIIGRGLGENARAALITRGLREMTRLAVAKGGRAQTLMGLSGLGDLTLTCTALQSRNCSLGVALGQGQTLAMILAQRHSVAEGVPSAASIALLAQRLGIDMPIVAAMNAILHQNQSIDTVIDGLLARPFKSEDADAEKALLAQTLADRDTTPHVEV